MGRTIAISLLATDRMSRTFNRAATSTERLNGALERVNKVGTMTGLAVGAASAVALTRALVPLAAAAAALPSALSSAVIVSKTLTIGLTGVGEAMKEVGGQDAKKLEEALKGLAPNARAFVKESAKLHDAWTKIQRRVQNDLFAGLDKRLRQVAKNTLPVFNRGMQDVAEDLNGVAVQAAKVTKTAWFKGRVAQMFRDAGNAVDIMSGAVRPLLNIITRLSVAGAPFVEQLAQWAVDGIRAADAWMRNEKNATKLSSTLHDIREGFSQVGNIARNLIAFLGGLLGASKEFNLTSGDMLTTLEKVTASMAAWANSAEGQKQMGEVFRTLADVANAVAEIMPVVGMAVSLVVDLLGSLPGPVREGIVQFLAWSIVISLIVGRLKALLFVVGAFKAVGTAFKGVQAGIKGLQAANTATRGFIAGFRNVNAAFSASASRATTLGAAIRSQIARWKQLTAQMLRNAKASLATAANWVKMKAVAAGTWIANAARAVASWAVALGRSSRAAATNAAAQLRLKAAAAGGWLRTQATALRAATAAQLANARAATASALASARQRAAIIASTVAQKAATVATKAMAIANTLLNVVLRANPIILIITLIIALGAAFILAYKKVDWFRNAVNAIFSFLKTAVLAVINFVKQHWRLIITIILGPLGLVLSLVTKYWTQIKNYVMTAVRAVIDFVKKHWRLIITIVLGPLGLVVALVTKYWNKIKSFVTAAVKAVIGFVRRHWRLIISIIGGPLGAVVALVTKHWTSIRNKTTAFWNRIKSFLSNVLDNVKRGFGRAVDGIARVWNGLRNAAKKPVNFVIGIYNSGIRPLVSKLGGLIGKDPGLPYINKFARGGVMPGYSPGNDSLLAAVSPGESIFRPEFTRAVGSKWVSAANAIARTGGPSAVRDWLVGGGDKLGAEGAGFARGGVASGGGFAGSFGFGGIVGGLIKGLKGFAFDNVAKAVKGTIGKILGGTVPGSGGIRDIVAGIPGWIKNTLFAWIKDKLDDFMGGKGMGDALNWAKGQAGKPYVWGGVGPGGYDCSGFMSAITNVIKGKSPYSRLFTTFSFTGARSGPQGFVRDARSGFRVGVTNAGVGHMAGTLLNRNVESSGSAGVRVGGGARGADNSLFNMRYGLTADTGALTLKPGWNPPVFNGTGRPEMLATPAASGEVHLHLDNHGVIGSKIELQNWLARTFDTLKRQGRIR